MRVSVAMRVHDLPRLTQIDTDWNSANMKNGKRWRSEGFSGKAVYTVVYPFFCGEALIVLQLSQPRFFKGGDNFE